METNPKICKDFLKNLLIPHKTADKGPQLDFPSKINIRDNNAIIVNLESSFLHMRYSRGTKLTNMS